MSKILELKYESLKELDSFKDKLNINPPGNLGIETTLTIKLGDQALILDDLAIIELYTGIKSWLDNDYLDIYEYTSLENTKPLFAITSEDGELWYLESSFSDHPFKEEVDIDDLILELWKFTVKLEVDIKSQFKFDLLLNEYL